ncbi:MAG: transmembrane Fragile-X-F family protein [Rhodobiaceae bacterium]|nr:MAG: transmembrane Fragile-X-F family protein [Rhodobiaceae bacterium]
MRIATIVFAVLLTLKLAEVVTWSWWIITAPLYIGFVLWLVLVVGIISGFAVFSNKRL